MRVMQSLKEVKPEPDPIVVAGLMAGTSLDGIDVVLACTDGHRLTRLCPAMTCPYSPQTRLLIEQAVELAGAVTDRPELLEVLDLRIAEEHAQAVLSLLGTQQQVMQPSLIGFHGQTVWHAPQAGSSVQLGDAQHLANHLGVDVIAELRQADLGAGGQGAPLAPVYHAALLDQAGITGSAAWLNLGGVANLTLLDGSISAGFDCGPANALMDRIARERLGKAYDCGGEKALTGVPDTRLVDAMLSDPYFDSAPPKSLDREHFAHSDTMTALQQMPVHDALATLAAFTVGAVERGLAWSARPVETLVVSGGGVHNRAVMQGLASLRPTDDTRDDRRGNRQGQTWRVISSDDIGAPVDGVEAELVAFLAARCVRGLPTSFPVTTGATKPIVGGRRFVPSTLV
jgi:anhydro-N-acetylmuramic acid kinase